MTDLIARVRAYVDKMPPAVAGQHGHDATFKVAITLVHAFGLSEGDAMPIMAEYSSRCSPPWSQKELQHKLSSAAQHARSCKPRGYLRAARYRFAPEESPPRDRSKKKISLCLTTSASTEAGHPVEEKNPDPATEPGVDLAELGTSDPSTCNTTAPGIPHPADQEEGAAGFPGWITDGIYGRHKLPACVTREAAALFSGAIKEARRGFTPTRSHLARAQRVGRELAAIHKAGAIRALANAIDYAAILRFTHRAISGAATRATTYE